jgi:hypothetical protein
MPRTAKTASAPRAKRGLAGLTIDDLQMEIRRRQRTVMPLQRRRDKLARKLFDLERKINSLGGHMSVKRGRPFGSGGGTRPRNSMTLLDAMQKVIGTKTMGVSEIAEAVQTAGYKTSSANFRVIVNQALLVNSDLFKKVARGQYALKK